MANRLTAEEIFAARDIEEREVEVPEWPTKDGTPGTLLIRTFSKDEANEMRKQAMRWNPRTRLNEADNDLYEPLLFVHGVVEPKFTLEQYHSQLVKKSAVAVTRIIKAIMDASGLSNEAVDEADKSAGQGSGSALRVLPGAGAQDDAGGITATDVGA